MNGANLITKKILQMEVFLSFLYESKTIAIKHGFSLNKKIVIYLSVDFNFSKVYVNVLQI